ncbi:MAG: hypothetical protein APG12_00465 [Candidatus Methanofastidiosum methylothiophilum]|uniref:DUF131 domain-containing protein n=1 Tax=Candidatus Methanofastidiosum methylothiophilum TaxID=1705564 RepID=A0A150ITP1_9EURY|nr:MAG: hypothetical protein APG10_00380 [Candidatus Methanofastidiosum methylthiophilus]KYC48245.1 MAG: hypothetical protein APG11_00484 [Candidatus Methanofastidiosum methylthiophilus]KYC50902.1 MAG: hypothetical protein APG12_00465 [Candidatus Methanofastidiosum methylthiophilus]
MYFDKLIPLGFIIVFIGIAIIISGTLLSTFRTGQHNEIETGGVILIGPIPIIFGNSKPLLLISIIGAVVLMVVYFIISRGELLR